MRKIPFLDLRVDDKERTCLLAAVDAVFRHGRILLGPEVEAFESALAVNVGRRFAVGVNSGTDAVYLALRALGIGPGDEVITTSMSWIATANAIALTGAAPVFADVEDNLNIDPESVDRLLSPRVKAILPVHFTGSVCNMPALMALATRHQLLVIEDVAQAYGATLDGKPAGSFGTIAAFSMNPMKVLAACGEAGAVVTDDVETRDRLIALRYNGTVNRETCIEPSHNGRLDTVQAAILLQRMKTCSALVARRRAIAALYRKLLYNIVKTPVERLGHHDVYYNFTLQTPHRDELRLFLESRGIETKIQHPILMPEQPAYSGRYRGEYSHAKELVKHIMCLPVHEKLSDEDVCYVAQCVVDFFKGGKNA